MTTIHTTHRLETLADLDGLSSYTVFRLARAMEVVWPHAWFKPAYQYRRTGTLTLDALGNFIAWTEDATSAPVVDHD